MNKKYDDSNSYRLKPGEIKQDGDMIGLDGFWFPTDCPGEPVGEYEIVRRPLPAPQGAVPPTQALRDVLAKQGVFAGFNGLIDLTNADEFWEKQMYGTRLYFGEGVMDYLHRDILRCAIKALIETQTQPKGAITCEEQESQSKTIPPVQSADTTHSTEKNALTVDTGDSNATETFKPNPPQSATPRTDAATQWPLGELSDRVFTQMYADLARQLETELNEANEVAFQWQKITHNLSAKLSASEQSREANAERTKMLGFYNEIVRVLGDDLVLKRIGDLTQERDQLREANAELTQSNDAQCGILMDIAESLGVTANVGDSITPILREISTLREANSRLRKERDEALKQPHALELQSLDRSAADAIADRDSLRQKLDEVRKANHALESTIQDIHSYCDQVFVAQNPPGVRSRVYQAIHRNDEQLSTLKSALKQAEGALGIINENLTHADRTNQREQYDRSAWYILEAAKHATEALARLREVK